MTHTVTVEDTRKLLRYSHLQTLNACPRKRELQAYMYEENGGWASLDTTFGTAYGAGVAELLNSNNNLFEGYMAALLAWEADRIPLDTPAGRSSKSFGDCLLAIEKYHHETAPLILQDWEVATLPNGRKAVETLFVLPLPKGYYSSGHIDVVLKHKRENRYSIREIKTTADNAFHEAKYGKSSQAVGYAAAIGAAYPDAVIERMYEVYHTANREYTCFPLPYSKVHATKWLVTQVAESERIGTYLYYGVFPQNGDGCMKYNRICSMYNFCSDANALHPEWEVKPLVINNVDLLLNYTDFIRYLQPDPLDKTKAQ